MNRTTVGTPVLIFAIVLAILMMTVTFMAIPFQHIDSAYGIALPSPNLWDLSSGLSWALNLAGLLGCVPLMLLLNKKFNVVQGNGFVPPAMFILLCGANLFISRSFCSSTLLVLVNIICLWVLFDTDKKRNATQDFFFIATLLALGAMIQYAFIPMIVVYIAGGIIMRSLRFKEAVAFLLGLIAPYWVAIGLGLTPLVSYALPHLSNLFSYIGAKTDLFITLIYIGLIFLISSVLCMSNAMLLYAGNTRIRRMNNCINVLGYVSAICMIADFNNLPAYMATLNLWMAVQTGNLFALHRIRYPYYYLGAFAALQVAAYVWVLLNA